MQQVSNMPLRGTIPSIPAKAHAHRALIAAALATSPSTIVISHSSKDIDATMDSLRTLGATITYDNGVAHITPGPTPTIGQVLPHESGTTLRLLLPVSASICNTVKVDAKGRLPERPLEPLLSEMKDHGVSFSQDTPPFIARWYLLHDGHRKLSILLWSAFGGTTIGTHHRELHQFLTIEGLRNIDHRNDERLWRARNRRHHRGRASKFYY